MILLRYSLRVEVPNEFVLSQKVALREVNAHSIVNATTSLIVSKDHIIEDARICFGGCAPNSQRASKVEAELIGLPLSYKHLPRVMAF